MIKVMGLALYGDKAASTRYRLFQYKSLLEESGIELEVFSLLSNEYLVKKFNGERVSLFVMLVMLVSAFNRIKILLKQKKHPEGCFFGHSDHRVELVGFEPTSKQGNHALSTCLVDHYFSTEGRGATPYLKLSH